MGEHEEALEIANLALGRDPNNRRALNVQKRVSERTKDA